MGRLIPISLQADTVTLLNEGVQIQKMLECTSIAKNIIYQIK
jgi:hypothetical protein